MDKEKGLPLPVGANVYDYVRRNRKQAMQIVAASIVVMVLLAMLGFTSVNFQHPGRTGMVWTLVHPLHLCILIAGATLAGAKLAEQTYRFALAVTLTCLAGLLATTALTTYFIHNFVVRLNWSWLR
jgi:hypothetical protein